MPDGSRHTTVTTIIQCHHGNIAQRQMQSPHALLPSHFPRHRTVHLVGQPILASHRLNLQDLFQIFLQTGNIVFQIAVLLLHRLVHHHRLGRIAKHIFQLQVNRLLLGLRILKDKTVVARGLPNHVHRGTFPVGNALQSRHILLLHHQPHPFLRFIAHDFLSRKGRVTDRQLLNMHHAPGLLHQLGQAIQMPAGAVVMDRDNRVMLALAHSTDGIINPFLHLRV